MLFVSNFGPVIFMYLNTFWSFLLFPMVNFQVCDLLLLVQVLSETLKHLCGKSYSLSSDFFALRLLNFNIILVIVAFWFPLLLLLCCYHNSVISNIYRRIVFIFLKSDFLAFFYYLFWQANLVQSLLALIFWFYLVNIQFHYFVYEINLKDCKSWNCIFFHAHQWIFLVSLIFSQG